MMGIGGRAYKRPELKVSRGAAASDGTSLPITRAKRQDCAKRKPGKRKRTSNDECITPGKGEGFQFTISKLGRALMGQKKKSYVCREVD